MMSAMAGQVQQNVSATLDSVEKRKLIKDIKEEIKPLIN
jgi:hypothetical protein